ncbi:hypothetical protein TNCV_2131971 [Trichonephila clavipes]|nr:hypothetical protein TNCV_2131971 [Trichonephila clavipes]
MPARIRYLDPLGYHGPCVCPLRNPAIVVSSRPLPVPSKAAPAAIGPDVDISGGSALLALTDELGKVFRDLLRKYRKISNQNGFLGLFPILRVRELMSSVATHPTRSATPTEFQRPRVGVRSSEHLHFPEIRRPELMHN